MVLEAVYLDTIRSVGFANVKLVSTMDIFKGAKGEASAKGFETVGATIRARKPS